MCFSVISSSAKRTEIHNQLNIVFFMLKIYLVRLEREQELPLRKASWQHLGAQQKVSALPFLRKDKGGNFFGMKTNPRKTQQTECFLFVSLSASPRAVSVLCLSARKCLPGWETRVAARPPLRGQRRRERAGRPEGTRLAWWRGAPRAGRAPFTRRQPQQRVVAGSRRREAPEIWPRPWEGGR